MPDPTVVRGSNVAVGKSLEAGRRPSSQKNTRTPAAPAPSSVADRASLVSTPAAAIAMTPAERQARASTGNAGGLPSRAVAGASLRRTHRAAAAKARAAIAKMTNAQRQDRR